LLAAIKKTMFRRFNLKIDKTLNEEFYSIGKKVFDDNRKTIKTTLDSFLLDNGSLNGIEIMENWFPSIKADIFLSHSHKDEKLAIIIAGMLQNKLGLKVFIDSSVWGYSNDLLKIIDEQYCKNTDGATYSYEKRNYSTSHVNLMLSNALNKMIDNCESIFFLNSPNSISMDNLKDSTKSPWIYSEISTAQIIRKVIPERLKLQTKNYSGGGVIMSENKGDLSMEYELNLTQFENISYDSFIEWVNSPNTKLSALDYLYKQHPIKKRLIPRKNG
jgi:hypothetical protein